MLPMTPMPSAADRGEAVGGMSGKTKLLEPGRRVAARSDSLILATPAERREAF